MFGRTRFYGLDIETDNSAGHGLNPQLAGITEIAVAIDSGGEVFDDTESELDLLVQAHQYLYDLEPGVIVTWNGGPFDMPFIGDRIKKVAHFIKGIGPVLTADPEIRPKYEPLPGHAGGYSALWPCKGGYHQHIDIAYAYKQTAEDLGVSWSLKPVCKALGIPMVEIDRTRLHTYSPEEVAAYALSDGHGARELALRALGA